MKIVLLVILTFFCSFVFSTGESINIQSIYPFDENLTFIFEDNLNTEVITTIQHRSWEDKKHFTSHNNYYKKNNTPLFCPRIDDVFMWQDSNLYYTHTYNFYDNTLFEINPGHLWAHENMTLGEVYNGAPYKGNQYNIEQTNCTTTKQDLNLSINYINWFGVFNDIMWSEYTGGNQNLVNVIRLDETIWFNNDPAQAWKEMWYFYDDPKYGYIPIYSTGHFPNLQTLMWSIRLIRIENKNEKTTLNNICSQFSERYSTSQLNTHITSWKQGTLSTPEIIKRAKINKYCN